MIKTKAKTWQKVVFTVVPVIAYKLEYSFKNNIDNKDVQTQKYFQILAHKHLNKHNI